MALNHSEIKFVLKTAKAVAIRVYQRNIVVLSDKVFCQSSADLPCAQYDNFHQSRLVISLLFD
ncbi:hypothetical protein A225_5306 [Klebsiella michiganensis E718]|nr:hypothetical protein A225_5306 [Klebsiella michiganensis E718]